MIACCQHCFDIVNDLSKDDPAFFKNAITDRVAARLRVPILFDVDDKNRRTLKRRTPRIECAKDVALGSYNRKDRNDGKRLPNGLDVRP